MKKLLLVVFTIFIGAAVFAQECSDLFISEYVEGSGNDKCVEIYNPTLEEVDLSLYTVRRYSNGSPVYTDEVILSGTIQANGVVVLTNGQTDSVWVESGGYWSLPIDPALYEKGDLHCSGIYPTAMYFNGNDAITLEKLTGDVVDIFGKIGTDPGSNGWNDLPPTYFAGDEYWTSWTKDQTLVRKPNTKDGVSSNPAVFMVNMEWDSLPKNTFDSLGFHTCDCNTLGIGQNKFDHSVIMYPNPAADQQVTISASERIEQITISNELGQVIISEEFDNGLSSITIRSEKLTSGIYIVVAKFIDQSIYTNKLIVH